MRQIASRFVLKKRWKQLVLFDSSNAMKYIKSNINKIENSRGRFFGLTTYDGRVYNAKLVRSTPNYVVIYDRNRTEDVRISKTNVQSVRGL